MAGYYPNYSPVPVMQQYPMNYQAPSTPTIPNVTQNINTLNSQSSNGIIWVQGEAGAKAYPVNAGNSVLLMDSETDCFYIKSTDASGMPMPLRAFQYSEIVQSQPSRQNRIDTHKDEKSFDTSQFVTRTEFEELKQAIQDMKPIASTRRKKEVVDNGE